MGSQKNNLYYIETDNDGKILYKNNNTNGLFLEDTNFKSFLNENSKSLQWNKNSSLDIAFNNNYKNYNWIIKHNIYNDKHEFICHDKTYENLEQNLNKTTDLDNELDFKMTLECLPNMICLIDNDMKILYVNEKWEIIGYLKDNLIGLDINSFFDNDENVLSNAISNQTFNKNIDVKIIKKDGNTINTMLFITPMNNTYVICCININDDINNYIIISRLIYEMKTSLNSIIGFTQLALKSQYNSELHEYVQIINESSFDLLKIINNVAQFNDADNINKPLLMRSINLVKVIKSSINFYQQSINNRKITIILNNEDSNIYIWGNNKLIEQLFKQLINNAIKFNKDYGYITINIILESDTTCSIEIINIGVGIPEKEMCNLYKPFNKLGKEQSIYSGLGLGLYMCKKIVNQHKWNIKINSTQNESTTVLLNNITYQKNDEIKPQQQMIVYIEDNPDNCKLMSKIVKRWFDIKLVSTPYAKIGLNLIEHQKPLILFLDLNLPDIHGLDILKKIRKTNKTLPIFVISADNDEHTVKTAKLLGCTGYISKPIFIEEIVQTINMYV